MLVVVVVLLPHWRFLAFILALFHDTGTPPRLLSFGSTYSELYPGYFRLLAFSTASATEFERRFNKYPHSLLPIQWGKLDLAKNYCLL